MGFSCGKKNFCFVLKNIELRQMYGCQDAHCLNRREIYFNNYDWNSAAKYSLFHSKGWFCCRHACVILTYRILKKKHCFCLSSKISDLMLQIYRIRWCRELPDIDNFSSTQVTTSACLRHAVIFVSPGPGGSPALAPQVSEASTQPTVPKK